jgi:hypothetical protein
LKRLLRGAALSCLLIATPAAAATFTKIADASTPGGGWTPSVFFNNPALDAGTVAVRTADVVSGIYIVSGGVATPVVDDTTLDYFTDPAISQGEAAFVAHDGANPDAVYRGSGGALTVVADASTPDPRGSGPLEIGFSTPDIAGDSVSFRALGFFAGIYTSTAGALAVSADGMTWLDGNVGGEIVFVWRPGSLDGSQVAYRGYTNNAFAVMVAESADAARIVADPTTPAPGGTGNFEFFDSLVEMDDGNVVFQGQSAEGWGVFAEIGGVLMPIAPVQALALAIDGDVIAFLGSDGLYAYHDGVLERLIGAGDSLDGKNIVDVFFGEHGLSGDQLAFSANFDDGSRAIYLATIPEPGTALLLASGLVALAARRPRLRLAR